MFLILTCFVSSGFAQNDIENRIRETERVRLKIDLSDQDLKNLKHIGKLRMRIPEHFHDRVAAIQLRYVDTYKTQSIRVTGEPTIAADTSHLTIDGLLLERIRFQPIEVRVFEKNFTHVQINYEPTEDPVFVNDENVGFTDVEYGIQIADRFMLKARISLENKLNLVSDVGAVRMDWNDIDQLTFSADEELKATVVMKTGDKLSGLVDLNELNIKTGWGLVTVPIGDVRMVLPAR